MLDEHKIGHLVIVSWQFAEMVLLSLHSVLNGWLGLVGRQPDSSQETEARKGVVPLTLSPYPVLSSENCSLHRSQLELTGNQIRSPHSFQTSHLNPAPLSAAEYTP